MWAFFINCCEKLVASHGVFAKIITLVFPLYFGLLSVVKRSSKPLDLNTPPALTEGVFFLPTRL